MRCPFKNKMKKVNEIYEEDKDLSDGWPCLGEECPTEVWSQCQGYDSQFNKFCANQINLHGDTFCIITEETCHINKEIAQSQCPHYEEGSVLE